MKLLFFFVDGLGLGEDASSSNPARDFLTELSGIPFTRHSAPASFAAGTLHALDATGGISGKPQSATGQASLLTGVNAQGLLGYHLTALPNQELVDLVAERSLMKILAQEGWRVTASNLYTPEFFERRRDGSRNRLPVSSLTIMASGAEFRFPQDYADGRALFADLTNQFLREHGFDLPLISPENAARRMVSILEDNDFVFHEYFATDTYAHKRRHEDLARSLKDIDRFLTRLREQTDPQETAILLVSDHGNCEDSTSADHNRNPVPLLLLSENEEARRVFSGLRSIEEVYGAILAYFGVTMTALPPQMDSDWC